MAIVGWLTFTIALCYGVIALKRRIFSELGIYD